MALDYHPKQKKARFVDKFSFLHTNLKLSRTNTFFKMYNDVFQSALLSTEP